MTAGYFHPLYAASLETFGKPQALPNSGGWILVRKILGSPLHDAMGLYPLFCCRNWKELKRDFELLDPDLVCLSLVTDPFGNYDPSILFDSFDQVVPFKTHFVADTSLPIEEIVSKRHREDARRSLRKVHVDVCSDPSAQLDQWLKLYAVLTERHQINSLRAFSRKSFALQFQVPGLVMFEAKIGQEVVGLDLWYVQGDVAQGHLAAFSKAGYDCHASYATKWKVIEYFKDKVRWINFGGAAGTGDAQGEGLTRFKRGWASSTRLTYFCTKVLNHLYYHDLDIAAGSPGGTYFPSYRVGEFQ